MKEYEKPAVEIVEVSPGTVIAFSANIGFDEGEETIVIVPSDEWGDEFN